MHKTEISQETLDAAARRRGGRRYAFADIDPTKTVLVVIDMQKYFMEPGMAAEVPVAREIVPNINKLASSLRGAGGQVAWVITTFEEGTFDDWSVMKDLFSRERCQAMVENLSLSSPGHALWPEFDVNDQDWHIDKNRFSAFINGSSDLEQRLNGAGIDTVIITGTLTDVCCESSARDAMMCNFKTIMITDANAASCDDDHNNALNAVARLFVDVLSTDEMIARLHEK
jgi:ureidoacrylate peracid hydrolase